MFEDAVGWWQQWEGVYLGFWKWFAFFSRTTCQINLDECCKCSEILLEMNSTVVTLDCFSLYGNLMHIASAVYFHFSDALNAKKKKKKQKTIHSFFLVVVVKIWIGVIVFWNEVRSSNVTKTQASFICNTTVEGRRPRPRRHQTKCLVFNQESLWSQFL